MTIWLLTWLWQGVALAAAATLLLAVRWPIHGSVPAPLSGSSGATRHLVWWSALSAVIWLGWTSSPYLRQIPLHGVGAEPGVMQEPWFYVEGAPPIVLSGILGVWAAVALIRLVRLIPDLHAVYSLRDRCRPFPNDVESQLPLWLETRGRGRRADLLLCDAVSGATVLGLQRPAIAVPSRLVAALEPAEIDQIVLHEYAHVQRRDDWTRLLQALLQAALWMHPAVAFIGRSLNREREIACDEWVVARTGLPKEFARCLAHAAEVRGRSTSEPRLVPTLFRRRHDLVRRVNRLLDTRGRTRRKVSLPAFAAGVCAMIAVSVQLRTMPLLGEFMGFALPEVAAIERSAFVMRSSFAIREPMGETPHAAAGPALDDTRPPRAVATGEHGESTALRTGESPAPRTNEPVDARTEQPTSPRPAERLTARSFPGAYRRPAPAPAPFESTSVWNAAATPGVAIAGAARQTGVGLAGAFSRAGLALARRF